MNPPSCRTQFEVEKKLHQLFCDSILCFPNYLLQWSLVYEFVIYFSITFFIFSITFVVLEWLWICNLFFNNFFNNVCYFGMVCFSATKRLILIPWSGMGKNVGYRYMYMMDVHASILGMNLGFGYETWISHLSYIWTNVWSWIEFLRMT